MKRGNRGFRGWPEIKAFVNRETGSRPEAVCEVLAAAEIEAYDIADHLRSDWQDRRSAQAWERIARAIARAHGKCKTNLPF